MRRSLLLRTLAIVPAALAPHVVRAQTAPIRFGAAVNDSYSQPFYAADGGFFSRVNLDVTMQTFVSAPAMVQAVITGNLDVGMADVPQVANAVLRGVPLAFFAGGAVYVPTAPTTLLCVAKNSPIRSAKELEGQSVAVVALASISSMTVQEWLRTNGADPTKVKLFEMPFAPMVPAIARGTVAAAVINEPFMSAGKDEIRVLADTYPTIAPSFYIVSYFASREWIEKNRAAARRLTQALYEAGRWANTHHDDSAPILAKYSKLEVERIRAMTRSTFSSALDPRLLQPVMDLAVKYGAMERPVRAADLIVTA